MKEILTLSILFASLLSFCQGDFIIIKKDTVKCTITTIERKSGSIVKIGYIDMTNHEEVILGKENCNSVTSLLIGKITFDYVPVFSGGLKTTRKAHMRKLINGAVKVYGYDLFTVNTSKDGKREITAIGSDIDIDTKTVQLGKDGKLYNVSSKRVTEEIIFPYLNKCSTFADNYPFKMKMNYLTTAFSLYNGYKCGSYSKVN